MYLYDAYLLVYLFMSFNIYYVYINIYTSLFLLCLYLEIPIFLCLNGVLI